MEEQLPLLQPAMAQHGTGVPVDHQTEDESSFQGSVNVTASELTNYPCNAASKSGKTLIRPAYPPRVKAPLRRMLESSTSHPTYYLIFFFIVAGIMLLPYFGVIGSLFYAAKGADAVTYSPFQPPSFPLAVRNPYLSAWFPGDAVASLPTTNAQFWSGNSLIWVVIARVNGDAYNLFGVGSPESGTKSASVVSAAYTATHSTFTLHAGGVEFELDFLSPITPTDYLRQSMPFSYLTVSINSYNGSAPDVQIYSDIDDSWNGQNEQTWVQTSSWNVTTSGSAKVWQIYNENEQLYAEGGPLGDMALWGNVMYATQPSSGSALTAAAGPKSSVRGAFVSNGTLSSLSASTPAWAPGGLAGFVHDLGTISGKPSVNFVIGFYRDCEVNYMGECRVGYFRTQYNDPISAITGFMNDYKTAFDISATVDTQVHDIGVSSHGEKYAQILDLAARQTYGACDETLPTSLDTDDHMVFIKEISSDGNVNTLDIIFPAFPQFYVMDPEYIRFMLEPVVQYLETSTWDEPYAIHDIGAAYPNATGHPLMQEEKMPLEESGNIIQLALAHAKITNSTAWADKHQPLLKKYADYLVNYGLYPAAQLSCTDAAGSGPNQTNLAIKSAVGMAAYGTLFGADNYTTAAQSYAKTIYEVGTDPDKTHFALEYGRDDSWYIMFNLYPDLLLDLKVFEPTGAYEMQGTWYPQVRSDAGVALDSDHDWSKTEWQLWSGAVGNQTTIDMFVDDLYTYVSNGLNTAPFSDRYFVADQPGVYYSWRNRPVVGGEFCLAALDGAIGLASAKAKRDVVARAFEA